MRVTQCDLVLRVGVGISGAIQITRPGLAEYRRISKVESFSDQKVMLIKVSGVSHAREDVFEFDLVVSDAHRFWVNDSGWQEPAEDGDQLLCSDASDAWLCMAAWVLATDEPDVGWATRDADTQGPTIDLRGSQVSATRNFDEYTFNSEALRKGERMKCTVHSIEVEELQAYFVGEIGVLVGGWHLLASS